MIELYYYGNYLQTFILYKMYGREIGSTNLIISLENSNPLYLYGSCHVISIQCKVLIDKHFVWILLCKIHVNDQQGNGTRLDWKAGGLLGEMEVLGESCMGLTRQDSVQEMYV